ncbi:MAG TPA: hypothetical protein VGF75_04135 [Candidatus Saccharimonadales bacterium]|jgi:hypothetical protein
MSSSTTKKTYDDKRLKRIFPDWYSILYGAACGFLIPWTILLSLTLPVHYVSQHWDIAWVGFDSLETVLFALTALLAFKRSIWTAMTSTMLGTTLLIDAWFDVTTARPIRGDGQTAWFEALVFEIPLSILSFALAYRVFKYISKKAIN